MQFVTSACSLSKSALFFSDNSGSDFPLFADNRFLNGNLRPLLIKISTFVFKWLWFWFHATYRDWLVSCPFPHRFVLWLPNARHDGKSLLQFSHVNFKHGFSGWARSWRVKFISHFGHTTSFWFLSFLCRTISFTTLLQTEHILEIDLSVRATRMVPTGTTEV